MVRVAPVLLPSEAEVAALRPEARMKMRKGAIWATWYLLDLALTPG